MDTEIRTSESADRFLRLTKTQWMGTLTLLIMCIFMSQAWTLWRTIGLVNDGVQAHKVECVYKASIVKQNEDTVELIPLSQAEREAVLIKRFGPTKLATELSHIPTSVLLRSAAAQRTTLRSLAGLTCP